MFHIGDFARSLETVIEPEVVADVKKRLQESAGQLDGGRFQNLRISESVFGGSPAGAELGSTQSQAHRVIADSIDGVVIGPREFHEGVVQAEQMLVSADDGAAADFNRQAVLTGIVDANRREPQDREHVDVPGDRVDDEASPGVIG